MRSARIHAAAVAAAAGLLLIAGCGSHGSTSNTTAAATAEATGASASPLAPAKPPSVGDAILLTGEKSGEALQITLVKAADPDTTSDPYPVLPADTRYVSVEFRIKDTGTVAYKNDPLAFITMKDAAGNSYYPDLAADHMGSGAGLDSVNDLATGDATDGTATFDIPNGVKVAFVQFGEPGGYGPVAKWSIG
jgi:hypothetical protein